MQVRQAREGHRINETIRNQIRTETKQKVCLSYDHCVIITSFIYWMLLTIAGWIIQHISSSR